MKGHDQPTRTAVGRLGQASGLALLVGLCVLAAWWGSVALLAGILAVLGAVVVHELGHFVTARWAGMKVTEFFVGFGPSLWSFRKGEVTYGVKLIPAGGYVRIIGMNAADEVAPEDEHRAFRNKSYAKRAVVLAAGSATHFIMAMALLVALHAMIGWPTQDETAWQVGEAPAVLADGSPGPAHAAGIVAGDRIVAVDGVAVTTWDDFVGEIQPRPGDRVLVQLDRSGEQLVVPVELDTSAQGTGRIGVAYGSVTTNVTTSPDAAVVEATKDFGEAVWLQLQGLWSLITNLGGVADAVASLPGDSTANENLDVRPVSIVGLVDIGASDSLSISSRLLLFALFNIFIGVLNLLPLPPLDGGHLAVATYERWRERGGRSRHLVDMRRLMPVVWTVFAFLVVLGLGSIYLDIANPLN